MNNNKKNDIIILTERGGFMKDITWIKTRFIAHRGLHSKDRSVPENSMKAFELAVNNNFGIEMDINVLRDGTVVVFHDITLKRLTGKNGHLSTMTYEQIKDLTLLDTNEHIPTLQEVINFVGGRVPLLIELKPLGNNLLLCEQFMNIMKDYTGVYAIHSFSPNIVYWFKKHHPYVIRGQITEFFRNDPNMKRTIKFLMKTMFFNRFTKPDFINYGIHDLPNKYCDKLYHKGQCIISYAAKNQAEFNMVKAHYDNAVFEFFIPEK